MRCYRRPAALLSALLFSILVLDTTAAGSPEESPTAPPNEEGISDDACQERFALVLGATGRVGRLVTNQLLSEGFCVRVLTRNATKAQIAFGNDITATDRVVDVVVGELGDGGASVSRAFQPKKALPSTSAAPRISHVVFCAGGEEADFDAVNHRGVKECATEAVRAGSVQSMVVISAAWVSKPYSLASLLFNSLYPQLPMGRHLQGEDGLRKLAADSSMDYVILRAGRLVTDEEYPQDGPKGLLYEQGDGFFFWGPAGLPGMCSTQLAQAVRTAMQVKGKYTVEITSGSVDAHDATVYESFRTDDPVMATDEEVEACHSKALRHLVYSVAVWLVLLLFFQYNLTGSRIVTRAILFLGGLVLYTVFWTKLMGEITVEECASKMRGRIIQEL